MTRLPHDHPTVETIDGTLRARGPTDRPCVRFSSDAADALALDEVVYLVVDSAARAQFVDGRRGPVLRGAFDTPEQARTPGAGTNRLAAWVDERGLSFGRTVHCDVVESGSRYGLRAPGESAVYDDPGTPDEGLQSIAEELADRE